MNVKVDLDVLNGLSTTLNGLANEAGSLAVGGVPAMMLLPFGVGTKGALKSVVEATEIAKDTQSTMCPAVEQRLDEIGALMRSLGIQFANADDGAAERIASAYSRGSGDWHVPGAK